MSEVLDAGFADPVLGAQSAFRAIMEALARPGMVQRLALPAAAPEPLSPRLAAVALTLLDHDSKVWMDPELMRSPAVRDWVAFHTGAPLTERPADAAFALVTDAGLLPPLGTFSQGTDEYPERSTTIVLSVQALEGGPELRLRGPGIKDNVRISPPSLPADFASQWQQNRTRFPRGVDLLMVSGSDVLALPRTTRVEA